MTNSKLFLKKDGILIIVTDNNKFKQKCDMMEISTKIASYNDVTIYDNANHSNGVEYV